MKRIFLLLYTFVAVGATAQIVNNDTYSAVAFWKRGEIVRYVAETKNYDIQNQDTTINYEGIYDVSIRVMQRKDDFILLEWVKSNPRILTDNTNGIVPKINIYQPTARYIIRTDAAGAFIGVDNWKQVSKNNIRVAERVRKAFRKKANADAAARIADKMIAYSQTEKGIIENELTFAKEHFCTFFGWQYQLDAKNVLKEKVDIDGDSIDTEKIIWLEEIDSVRACVEMKEMQFCNPQQTAHTAKLLFDIDSLSVIPCDNALIMANKANIIHNSGWLLKSGMMTRLQCSEGIKEHATRLKIKTNLNR